MKKLIGVIFLILLGLIPSISISCSMTMSEKKNGGKCVDVGGYKIYARIFGKSAPVVIFDSGMGDDSAVWNAVSPQVSTFAKVVIYDRAGFGKSDSKPGDNLITSQDAVNTLISILKKEKINPPYILVGHSLGGLNMRLFAQKYPKDIAGVVLVDSVSRKQNFPKLAPSKSSRYYREAMGIYESRMEVKNLKKFPPVPLIVLTATIHDGKEKHEVLWQKWQKEMTKLSPNGIQIYALGSSHYIQKQQPQLVIDAIYTITQLAKGIN